MKKLTIILFVVLVLAAGIGFVAYARMAKSGGAASTGAVTTTTSQAPGEGFPGTTPAGAIPSPLPTVAQIPLTITAPLNGSSVTSPTLIIRGVTSPKADVFVNDAQVTADVQGSFIVQVTLDEGENTLVVTANDANGNYSEQDLTITYNSGQ